MPVVVVLLSSTVGANRGYDAVPAEPVEQQR